MVTNYADVVSKQKALEPADTFSSADKMLGFVLRVIAQLPPQERIGLVKGPQGGENIARYLPTGDFVRVNRVAYPDGQLVKILTDSGPGGANGPAWNLDDIRPDLYLEIPSGNRGQPPVNDNTEVLNKLNELEQVIKLQNMQLNQMAQNIQIILNKPDPTAQPFPIRYPLYRGNLFGLSVTLRPDPVNNP